MFESGLWIIVLEMLAAVVLAAFIIWWTLPKKVPAKDKETPPQRREGE